MNVFSCENMFLYVAAQLCRSLEYEVISHTVLWFSMEFGCSFNFHSWGGSGCSLAGRAAWGCYQMGLLGSHWAHWLSRSAAGVKDIQHYKGSGLSNAFHSCRPK